MERALVFDFCANVLINKLNRNKLIWFVRILRRQLWKITLQENQLLRM
jgi:hypothetical protein